MAVHRGAIRQALGDARPSPRRLERRESGGEMCIAYPARILALDAGSAVVDIAGRTRRASLLMAPDIEVGAWVLVAAGSVIRRIDTAEALDLASQLDAAMAAAALPPDRRSATSSRPGGSS